MSIMNSASEASSSVPLQPLSEVLSRIRSELEDIALRIENNQSAIARSTWQHGVGDEAYLQAMQDADLSAQRLSGLARYIKAIEDASPSDWQVETSAAAATVTLAAMGAALAGRETDRDAPQGGEVDLF